MHLWSGELFFEYLKSWVVSVFCCTYKPLISGPRLTKRIVRSGFKYLQTNFRHEEKLIVKDVFWSIVWKRLIGAHINGTQTYAEPCLMSLSISVSRELNKTASCCIRFTPKSKTVFLYWCMRVHWNMFKCFCENAVKCFSVIGYRFSSSLYR